MECNDIMSLDKWHAWPLSYLPEKREAMLHLQLYVQQDYCYLLQKSSHRLSFDLDLKTGLLTSFWAQKS
jgi:hypothetical protein